MSDQLVPRMPRRMKQPTKARMRELLAASASEIERLEAAREADRVWYARPWWHRLIYSRDGHKPPHRMPPPPAPDGEV